MPARRDPVDLIACSIHHLIEAVAVVMFIAMVAVWVLIIKTDRLAVLERFDLAISSAREVGR